MRLAPRCRAFVRPQALRPTGLALRITVGAQLHTSPSRKVQLSQEALTKKIGDVAQTSFDRLRMASHDQLYHWTHWSLAGLIPAAMVLSPSFLNWPVDLALGVIIPAHMHMGFVNIIQDYVPRQFQDSVTLVMWVLSVLTTLGLLKINLCGPGITESFKSLWRAPPAKKAKALPAAEERS